MALTAPTQEQLVELQEQTKELFVVNKPAYVWRVNSLGMGEHHGHIPCWYIVDRDGNPVDGGYRSGNNCQSGSAHIPRKKDAMAIAKGLQWGLANADKLDLANFSGYHIDGWQEDCPFKKTYDDGCLYGLYENGILDAVRFLTGRRNKLATGDKIIDCRKYKVK